MKAEPRGIWSVRWLSGQNMPLTAWVSSVRQITSGVGALPYSFSSLVPKQ